MTFGEVIEVPMKVNSLVSEQPYEIGFRTSAKLRLSHLQSLYLVVSMTFQHNFCTLLQTAIGVIMEYTDQIMIGQHGGRK